MAKNKKARKEELDRSLSTYINSIEETLQLVDDAPPPSLEKVPWNEVTAVADHISKQATIAAMLWTGATPDLKELEECMNTYFKMLQGFLLLSNVTTIGAGPTLRSCILASAKNIVNCSVSLLKEAVSSYGSSSENKKRSITQLAGLVWNACDSLKKTPTTNYTAIGRAITRIAVSLKDVLREMKELKPASINSEDETREEIDAEASHESQSDQSSTGADLGTDLSLEEMKIAEFSISFVSDTLTVIKELIRFISSFVKHPDYNETTQSIESLEKFLELCQGIGVHVNELGACLYPPQELPAIKTASDEISTAVNEIKVELLNFQVNSSNVYDSCEGFDKSLRELQLNLGSSDVIDIIPIQNLMVSIERTH